MKENNSIGEEKMEKYLAGLAEQAEQLNSVRSILQFGVFTCKCDEDFTIITIDEHFSEMFGYTKKELMEISLPERAFLLICAGLPCCGGCRTPGHRDCRGRQPSEMQFFRQAFQGC